MATYSGILAWEIPWTEEPAGLQFMGSQRVGHSLGTKQRMHVKPTACRKVLPEEQGVATVGGVGLVDDAGGRGETFKQGDSGLREEVVEWLIYQIEC